jgi:uncharacterized protein YcbX
MMPGTLDEIHVYPVSGEPGEDLQDSVVEPGGLADDRRKKAAVHVVAGEDAQSDTRANLVVSLGSAELAGSVGSLLRVGEVELAVTGAPTNCPGVYAAVQRGGAVHVGDAVTIGQ